MDDHRDNITVPYEDSFANVPSYLIVLMVAVDISIILGAVFGNILTIVAVIKVDRLRKVGNSFIVSLAVADLMAAIVPMPLSMMQNMFDFFQLEKTVCFLFLGTDYFLFVSSVLNICCISLDRFLAIRDPLHYVTRMTQRTANGLLSATWVIAAVVCYGLVFSSWIFDIDFIFYKDESCRINGYSLVTFMFEISIFWFPCIVILVLYAIIYRVARKQANQVFVLSQTSPSAQTQPAHKCYKAMKTIGLVTGMFMFCWMPVFVLAFASFVCKCEFPLLLWWFAVSLSYLGTLVNPIIYAAMNQDFRKAFAVLLCTMFKTSHRQ